MINKFVRIFLIVVFSLGIFSGFFLESYKTVLAHFHYANGQVQANLDVSSNSCGSISVSYSGTNVLPYSTDDQGGGCTLYGYGYGSGTGVYQGGGSATFGDVPAGNYDYDLWCYNEYNGRQNSNHAYRSVTVAACPPPTGTIQGYCVDENNNAIGGCNVVVDGSLPFSGTPYFATNLSAGNHTIAVHAISGFAFLGYTLDPNHGPITTSTFPGTWPTVTVPAGGAVNVWFHFGRTVNGQCSTPATHNNCAAGTLGGTATYPEAYHWWCNGNYGGSNQLCAEARPVCSTTPYACTQGASGSNSASNNTYNWNCSAGGETVACSTPVTAPTCSSATPDNVIVTTASSSHDVYINGVANTTAVKAYVWSENGGQDDLWANANGIHSAVNQGGGVWKATIPFSSHPDYGAFNVHAYMESPGFTGIGTMCDTADFTRQGVPVCGATHYSCTVGTTGSNSANAHTWTWTCTDGGATVSCSQPIPPPANPVSSCSANGTVGTVSWTLPSGYSNSYFRIVDDTAAAWLSSAWIPESVSDTGPSTTFATTPGHSYTAWIHTRPVDGGYSPEVYTSFNCPVVPDPVCGATPYACSPGTSENNLAGHLNYSWNCSNSAGTTVACSVPIPSPTAPIIGCAANGTSASASWNLPSGYSNSYFRLQNLTTSTNLSFIPENVADTGPSTTFAVTPGHNYQAWVHTRVPGSYNGGLGGYSPEVYSGWFNCTPAPVSVDNVTISPASVTPDGTTPYNITVTGTTANGGANMSHQFAIINHQGANAGMYRGYLTWKLEDDWATEKNKQSCTGGGVAAIQSSGAYGGPYGHEYIELDSCSTSVEGNTRTTTFTVRFNPIFTTPTTNNTLSGYVVANGVPDGWESFATFNLSSMTGTLTPTPSTCVIARGASSCTVNLSWNTVNPVATSAVTSDTDDTGASAPNTTVANGNSGGPVSVTIPYSGRNLFLYNNVTLLDQETVTSACDVAAGDVWNGTVCQQLTVLSGSLSGSNCLIAEGESSCNTNLSWNVTYPESAPTAITANGMDDMNVSLDNIVSPQSGQEPVNIPFPGRTFYLYNNAKSLHPTAESPNGSGLSLTARCEAGLIWDGSKCMEGIPRNPIPDLRLENADHDSTQSALGVLPGQIIKFTWNVYQTNSSIGCWLEDGVSGDNWSGAVLPDHPLDFPYTAPTVPGTYKYTLKCTQDRDLGMEESNDFLSLLSRKVVAADLVTVSDSAFLRVGQMIIDPCEGANSCSCEGSTCNCYSGQCITISWQCNVPPSTASEGVGFSTDINGDGLGDTSGSVTFIPVASGEYSMQCNNGGGSGGESPIIVNVKKKPIFKED